MKKIIVAIIICIFTSVVFSQTTYAATQNALITVKTGDNPTDGDVYGWVTFVNGINSPSTKLDTEDVNDFQAHAVGIYSIQYTDEDPWNVKSFSIKHNGALRGMNAEYVKIMLPNIDGKVIKYINPFKYEIVGSDEFTGMEGKSWGNGTVQTMEFDSRRRISAHSFGNFSNNNSSTAYIFSSAAKKSDIAFTASTVITDQFGTYDCLEKSNSPTCTIISVKDEKNNDYKGFFKLNLANGKISMELNNETAQALWQQMTNNDAYELTATVSVSIGRVKSINGVETATITSNTMKLCRVGYGNNANTLTASNNCIVSSKDNYYYNRMSNTFSADLTFSKPSALSITESTFTAKLLMGKNGVEIPTTVKIIKKAASTNSVTLNFSAIIPNDISSNGLGVYLNLTPADIPFDGKTYMLSKTASTDNANPLTLNYYYAAYKVDTQTPTVYVRNNKDQEIDLSSNEAAKKHNFYLQGSEAFKDSIVTISAYNDSTNSFNPILSLTNPNSTIGDSSQNAPISTGKLDELRLQLAEGYEGTYTINISGSDIAQNPMTKTFTSVKLDSLAPRVTITPSKPIQETDGSKRIDYSFAITDLAPHARVYYCFVPEGQSCPAVGNSTPSTADAVESAKWYFVENGQSATTAVLKVNKDSSFVGKLYYYTDDQLGNSTTPSLSNAQTVILYNSEAKGTINPGSIFAKKPNYDISFDLPNNETAQYRWVDKNVVKSGFEQDYVDYITGQSIVGAGQQIAKDGNKYYLDGSYRLEYKIINTLSGNYTTGSVDYYFDNSSPSISLPKWESKKEMGDSFKVNIKMSDNGGIEKAYYRIINPDGTPINDYLPVELTVADEKVDSSISITGLPSGIYGLELYAKDLNGSEKTVRYGYSSTGNSDDFSSNSMLFSIKSKAPTIELLNEQDKTVGKDYSIKATVTEDIQGLNEILYNVLGMNQQLKYQVAKDMASLQTATWQTTGASIQAISDGKITFDLNLESPVDIGLEDGQKYVYFRVACFDTKSEQASDSTNAKYISEPTAIGFISDNTAPTVNLEHESTKFTNGDAKIQVYAYDQGSDTTLTITAGDISDIISIKAAEAFSKEYTIPQNCTFNISAVDMVGNSTIKSTDINYIDKTPPEVVITETDEKSGDRADVKLTINIEKFYGDAKFYLISEDGENNQASQADFVNAITNRNIVLTQVLNKAEEMGEYSKTFTIKLRGLTGQYKIGVSVSDSLGNISNAYSKQIQLSDVEPENKTFSYSPKTTKNYTKLNLAFNVPVLLLPIDEYTTSGSAIEKLEALSKSCSEESFKIEHNIMVAQNDINVVTEEGTKSLIYYIDELGRQGILDVQLLDNVKFLDSFKYNIQSYINNEEIITSASNWIGLNSNDTIKVVITPNATYQVQFFYVDSGIGDAIVDTDNSVATTSAAIEVTVYSKLVLNVKTGTPEKLINFYSYTQEGNEEDRIQSEILKLKVDENMPTVSLQYDTTPRNTDESVDITFKDEQSGIAKIEEFIDGQWQQLELDPENKMPTFTRTFESNDQTRRFRITDKAGLVVEKEVNVTNIDKTPIQQDTHYTVKYEYKDYANQINTIIEGRSYRSVIATIIPVTTTNKTISSDGNVFSCTLDNASPSKIISIRDQYGNTKDVTLQYSLYDTTAPQIEEPSYSKEYTNKDTLFTVAITDTNNDSEIATAQVFRQDGSEVNLTKVSNGNFKGYLDESGTYSVVAYDYAGNKQTSKFVVDTISKKIPVGNVEYAVTKPTNQYVLVTVKFDTNDIVILDVLPVSGTVENMNKCITYAPGSDKIRFKKNTSVTMSYKDKFGNIGYSTITVSNIKQVAPNCEAVMTMASDNLSADITFAAKQVMGQAPDDLSTLYVSSPRINAGILISADIAKAVVKENGTYSFNIYDEVGNMQVVTATVSGIDKTAPKVVAVEWEYDYNRLTDGVWGTDKISGTHSPTTDTSISLAPSPNLPETNKDVKVTVKTDKEIIQIGSFDGKPSTETSMIYSNNGLFSFNLEGKNKTSVQYAVDVSLIDKAKPVISFTGAQELIYIQNGKFDKNDLLDYKAYDMSGTTQKDLTSQVKVNYGNFDPNNFDNMTFDRNKPYYIKYSVYDTAGT